MDPALVTEYITVSASELTAKEALKALTDRRKDLENAIISYLNDNGLSHVTVGDMVVEAGHKKSKKKPTEKVIHTELASNMGTTSEVIGGIVDKIKADLTIIAVKPVLKKPRQIVKSSSTA